MVAALSLSEPEYEKGQEEFALLAGLPGSARLRRVVADLEAVMVGEGFLHLATDELARRLQCSKATLYRLAPSREEVFEVVIGLWLARIRDAGWHALEKETSWRGRLTAYLTTGLQSRHAASPEFIRDISSFPAGFRQVHQHQSRREEGLRQLIEGGIAAGEFRDMEPRLAAGLVLTGVRKLMEPGFLDSVGLRLDEAFDQLYGLLESGMIAQDGS